MTSTAPMSRAAQDLSFLVSNLITRAPGIREAVVVSSDGLLIAMSERLERADADRLAAVAAGLTSIARGAGQPMDAGAVNEIIIEMERALLIVMCISDGSALAVVATRPCDVGLVAYEMALLTERASAALTPALVAELKAALPQ
jgi:predicted regulator of Ras-like GTPase activity (Roadblock/LC7/MglB family)